MLNKNTSIKDTKISNTYNYNGCKRCKNNFCKNKKSSSHKQNESFWHKLVMIVNTTYKPEHYIRYNILNYLIIIISILIFIESAICIFIPKFLKLNNINSCKIWLWIILQILYVGIGSIECHDVKKHPSFHQRSFSTHAHNIFYITLLYLILSLSLFYWYMPSFNGDSITTAVEIAGVIITASAFCLQHDAIASITGELIVITVFFLMNFGLIGCLFSKI